MTYEGSPAARFRRAVGRGDMMGAEAAAFELGSLGLEDSLALVALDAGAGDGKFDRAAVRWLGRLLDERPVALSEARRAAERLEQLRGGDPDLALGSLGSPLHGWVPLPSARGRA